MSNSWEKLTLKDEISLLSSLFIYHFNGTEYAQVILSIILLFKTND